MTQREFEQYKALLTWVKALDAETEVTLARILAALACKRVENWEERKADRGEWAAVRF